MAGAINHRPTQGEAICPYCGVGCRLWAEVAYDELLRVKGSEQAPANLGRICAKGATLPQVLQTPDRLTQPQLRVDRFESFQPVRWDQAMQYAARRFAKIIERHGPDAVAFYGSGQLDSETVYLVGKLFKGHLGTNNTDSNSRLCMATAVSAYVTALGSDGPPTCYEDIDHADLIIIIGSNMMEAHPVTFDRVRAARKQNPNLRVVVIDPRRTKTAENADVYFPVAPGGDIALLNLVGQKLLQAGKVSETFVTDHTEGFENYAAFVQALDPMAMLKTTGLDAAQVDLLSDWIGNAKAMLSFYCMGMGQSTAGTGKILSLLNLHLLTGQIGRVGAGPFSLTGQPNAMGGREGGLLAPHLPGYRFVKDAEHRRQAEEYWQLKPGSICPKPGLTAVEMFRALESGKLKAIWIAATNPMVSLPDLHQVRRALDRAEFVVVQDPYHPTETTRRAHLVLPVANWLEKEWTSTNSERMVSFSEKMLPTPGTARSDWEVIAHLARTMGFSGFEYENREQVWDEFIGLTAGRPCDMSGMTADRLRQEKNLQWPCPTLDHPGSKRRYLDHRFATPNGRAKFVPCPYQEPCETPDHEFPFVLNTGRIYAHWHTMTRTGKSSKLMARDSSPYVEIHPHDAERLQIAEGNKLRVSSRRGTLCLPARITEAVQPGSLFVPFHWGDEWGEETAANYLTLSALDPQAKQPEFKYCAAAVELVSSKVWGDDTDSEDDALLASIPGARESNGTGGRWFSWLNKNR